MGAGFSHMAWTANNYDPGPELVGAALDREALGAPAQHAAGEIGDFIEAGLAEEHGGLRRARAGAAHRHHGFLLGHRSGALAQLAQRYQDGPGHVAERAVEFVE